MPETTPAPESVPESVTRQVSRSRPVTLRWLALAAAAVLGLLGFSVLSAVGSRAGLSFVGGLALAVASFEFGAFNIRFTGRHLPAMTLLVAMLSYLTTAIALGLVLAAASPRVVDGQAIAVGLFTGLVIWLGSELAASRAVQGPP